MRTKGDAVHEKLAYALFGGWPTTPDTESETFNFSIICSDSVYSLLAFQLPQNTDLILTLLTYCRLKKSNA